MVRTREAREVEKRKIQKLGSSSLVVTLPKSWVRRVNLKQGDTVYVVVEGNTLRVIPGALPSGKEEKTPVIDLSKVDGGRIAPHLIVCMYVLGYNDVLIRLGNVDLTVINRVLASASRLLGVEASCLGNNVIKMSVLIDTDKLDINASIRTMTRNLGLLIEAILRAMKDRQSREQLLNDVIMLYNEVFRVQHSIMRQTTLYLQAKRIPVDLESPLHVLLLGSSLLGEAALIAYRAAKYISRIGSDVEVPGWLEEYSKRSVEIVEELGRVMVSPSLDNAVRLVESVSNLVEELGDRIVDVQDARLAYLASKLEDFLETVRIVALITLCGAAQKMVEEQS